MSYFREQLSALQEGQTHEGNQHIFVPYDQLTDQIGPLADATPAATTVVFVETSWKPCQRPYHKQKLAWILANQRHFALELARQGFGVDYRFGKADYGDILAELARQRGPLVMMAPAERELHQCLAPLIDEGSVTLVPHRGWLTTTEQFLSSQGNGPPWRMDAFYRQVRRDSGLLMEAGRPLGGQFSFDEANRQPWSGDPPAPSPPTFEPDRITQEVGDLIEERFADHPGRLDLGRVAATADQAQAFWDWAKEACMTHFGPYEDAMSVASRHLFHTLISPLLNQHRLLPQQVVQDVVAMDIPLNSNEGFLRQVLGWREFMRHVYHQTEGFERLPEGYEANYLQAHRPLPDTYWGGAPSGLNCLDEVVQSVVDEGYSHHITRLMVLANIATLLDISPEEITHWFWAMYIDAYDWVVEPNVRGMGVFALGDLFTTKPYISGSNYIHKMSDYCGDCAFNPKGNCPIRSLYWAFLARHRDKLERLGRMGLMLSLLNRRSEEKRAHDQKVFDALWARLEAGEPIAP